MGNSELRIDLKTALKRKNMTAKELAQKTGIREATISEMSRRNSLNLTYIAKILEALEISDIRELLIYEEKNKK